jgi:DNA-binding transcriptional LysR family regulator
LPIELFCSLPHAIRSTDGSMSGATDAALARAGHQRQVTLAVPHFQAVAEAVAKGRLIAVVPQQFAEAVADDLQLVVYQPPIEMAVPDVKMYWHNRQDNDAAHRWFRHKILTITNAIANASG